MEWWQKYPAAGMIRGHRVTILDRIRLRRRRGKRDDLEAARRW